MTRAQARALEQLWSRYGLPANQPLDVEAEFGSDGMRVLEIGFGMGDALVSMATAAPASRFVGLEVYEPGIGRLLHQLAAHGLDNVRVLRGDAFEVLPTCFAAASLDVVLLYFPDPWPKKRHHRRRLLQVDFTRLVSERLRPGGHFELATDVEDYAEHMLEVLDADPTLTNVHGTGAYAPRPDRRPASKFERRGERLGHVVRDLVYQRL